MPEGLELAALVHALSEQQAAFAQQHAALLQLQAEALRLQRLLIEGALGASASTFDTTRDGIFSVARETHSSRMLTSIGFNGHPPEHGATALESSAPASTQSLSDQPEEQLPEAPRPGPVRRLADGPGLPGFIWSAPITLSSPCGRATKPLGTFAGVTRHALSTTVGNRPVEQ